MASAKLAAITSILGRLPDVDEYLSFMKDVNASASDTYRYLNFDQLPQFVEQTINVKISDEMRQIFLEILRYNDIM